MYHDPKWMRNEGQDKKKEMRQKKAWRTEETRKEGKKRNQEELRSREEIGDELKHEKIILLIVSLYSIFLCAVSNEYYLQ